MTGKTGRILKIAGVTAAVLAATIVVTAVSVALWLTRSVPPADGETVVAGLGAPVEIVHDSRGIPHILSKSRHDAAFALGRLHAEERLFQMELFRRFGQGRLAEVLGEPAVSFDLYARTIGAARLAANDYAAASPELRATLEAYAAGVNSWLAGRDRPLPPEFTLLMFEPEPWAPQDSLMLGKLLGLMLTGNWQTEALRARLAARLDGESLEALTPPQGGGPAQDGASTLEPFAALPALHAIADMAGLDLPSIAPLGAGASNAWAVDGTRSATGKPILANDPHLGLMAPGLWYLAHLSAPDLTLVGATLPGIPMLLMGHNGHVAWGQTTANGDGADLFVETIDPADPGRYLTPDGSRPFETREETIEVRLGETRHVTIRATRHGPVVSDLAAGDLPRAEGTVVALSHVALMPGDTTAEAMLRFSDAKTADDFLAAARLFAVPHQNLTYADTAGAIGTVAAGRLPIRKGGDGRLPADGASGAGDWIGFIPFEGLPQVLRPGSGMVLNANNAVTGPDYPYLIGKDYDVPYRAERIAALLAAKPTGYGLDDAAAGQMDIVSPFMAEFMPRLIPLAGAADGRLGQALDILKAWDFRMAADRAAPLIASAWARHLNRRLFAERLGPDYGRWAGLRPLQLRDALDGRAPWCDAPATEVIETCAQAARAALEDAVGELTAVQGDDPAAWRWGTAHVADMQHPILRFLPVVGPLVAVTPEVGGGDDTLERGAVRFDGKTPYASVHGAGFRAIYDLADLDRSRFMIATGQSGNPYSPHWSDLAPLWAEGRYVEIPTGVLPAEGTTRRLRPGP